MISIFFFIWTITILRMLLSLLRFSFIEQFYHEEYIARIGFAFILYSQIVYCTDNASPHSFCHPIHPLPARPFVHPPTPCHSVSNVLSTAAMCMHNNKIISNLLTNVLVQLLCSQTLQSEYTNCHRR